MPEYYADKMRELYEIIERMGVTRQMEGVEYVAFMLYRLHKDQGYVSIEQLYKITADRFKRGLTKEMVKDAVFAVQVNVYKIMTSTQIRFDTKIQSALYEYIDGNVNVIQDTEKFMQCLLKVAFDWRFLRRDGAHIAHPFFLFVIFRQNFQKYFFRRGWQACIKNAIINNCIKIDKYI